MNLEREKKKVGELMGELAHLEKSKTREERALQEAVEGLHSAQEAQEILQLLAQSIQQQAHKKIARVVSRCLAAVFDEPYEFRINFERKRGKTEAQLRFVRGDLEVDPLSASGGGMVDVASFALRLACLLLSRPKLSGVIVLDEPFKFVSAEFRRNVREMLEQLSEEMGVQIIQITHIEELETGKVIEL